MTAVRKLTARPFLFLACMAWMLTALACLLAVSTAQSETIATGMVILAGNDLESPYELVENDDGVSINGYLVAYGARYAISPKPPGPQVTFIHNVVREIEAKRTAGARDSELTAFGLRRFLASPLVRSARITAPLELAVHWHGLSSLDMVVLWPEPPEPDISQHPREIARLIRHGLLEDCILLIGGGALVTVPPAQRASALAEIARLRRGGSESPSSFPSIASRLIQHPTPLSELKRSPSR